MVAVHRVLVQPRAPPRTFKLSCRAPILFVLSPWIALIAALLYALCYAPTSAHAKSTAQPHVLFVSLPWTGHMQSLRAIAKELVARGFAVSFALPLELKRCVANDGFRFIPIGSALDVPPRNETLHVDTFSRMLLFLQRLGLVSPSYRLAHAVHHSTPAADLIRSAAAFRSSMYEPLLEAVLTRFKQKPGLMVVDRYCFAGIDVAQHLRIPYIINSPTMLWDIDGPPSHLPAPMALLSEYPLTLWQRALNILHRAKFQLESHVALKNYPGAASLSHANLILCNTVFGMELQRPLPPSIKMIGPVLPLSADPLSASVKQWLNSAHRKGQHVIVVELSDADTLAPELTAKLTDVLMKGLRQRKWRVLVHSGSRLSRGSGSAAESQSSGYHSRYSMWKSHLAVDSALKHKSVRALVSFCSLYRVQQACFYGKPVLCLPLLTDQWEVAQRVVQQGLGTLVDASPEAIQTARSVVINNITQGVRFILANERIRSAVSRFRSILRASGGTREAASVIELSYRIGMTYLHTMDLVMPWYQYMLLDVYLVCSVVIALCVVLFRSCWAGCNSVWEIVKREAELIAAPVEQ